MLHGARPILTGRVNDRVSIAPAISIPLGIADVVDANLPSHVCASGRVSSLKVRLSFSHRSGIELSREAPRSELDESLHLGRESPVAKIDEVQRAGRPLEFR